MRRFILLMLAVLFYVLTTAEAVAQPKWWPFGAKEQPPVASSAPVTEPMTQAPVAEAVEGQGWMMTSPLANVSWPEVKMPKLHWKQPTTGQADGEGNFITKPLRRAADATQRFAQRSREKWNKTMDGFKIRDRQPSQGGEQGFFARIFSSPEKESPQTKTEFLAQERPTMSTR